jgi:hypothetical protein
MLIQTLGDTVHGFWRQPIKQVQRSEKGDGSTTHSAIPIEEHQEWPNFSAEGPSKEGPVDQANVDGHESCKPDTKNQTVTHMEEQSDKS